MTAKIVELRKRLLQCSHEYFVLQSPSISDFEYDRLFRELQELEAKHPEDFDPNSPTARVGYLVPNDFQKVTHHFPMMSLENSFTASEVVHKIVSEAGPCEVILEPKVDGLALSLIYDNGRLIQATTRGNHEVGDDVTTNARTIQSIPLVIDGADFIEVRGEVFLSKANFEKLNAAAQDAAEEPFSNARNAAAGSLKQKDSRICAKRGLEFFAYSIMEPRKLKIQTQQEVLVTLSTLGFKTALTPTQFPILTLDGVGSDGVLFLNSVEKLQRLLDEFDVIRKSLPFDTDGCVVKVNSLETQEKLGNKTRSPRWATAFKYPAESVTTTILGITVQVGRRGTLTPVAELKPVEVAGAVVKRATLNNIDYVNELGVNIGDEVQVVRSGEVIPTILSVSKKKSESTWNFPETCPCCSTLTIRNGVHYFCPNSNCPDQVFQRIQHAVSKGSLDMDKCGPAVINSLIDNNVKTLSGILELTEDQIKKMLKPAAAAKLLAERERVKSAPLWRKFASLGIDLVGQTASKDLASRWHSLDEIIDAGKTKLLEVLGPVAAENFINFLSENVAELGRLEASGFIFKEEVKSDSSAGSPLAGYVVVLTGTMMSGSRPKVSEIIEKYGGKVKGSMSREVTHLVVGEGAGAGKSAAAQKLGTKILTEEELYAAMGVEMPIAAYPEED